MTMTVRFDGQPVDDDQALEAAVSALASAEVAALAPAMFPAAVDASPWRRQRLVYRWSGAAVDLALVSMFGYAFAHAHLWPLQPVIAGGLGLLFVLTVGLKHGYDPRRAATGGDEFSAIGRGMLALALAALIADFAQVVQLQPALSTLWFAATGAVVLLGRFAQRGFARLARRNGHLRRRTLIIGSVADVKDVRDGLNAARSGFDVVGACVPRADAGVDQLGSVPVWGTFPEAADYVAKHSIDAVVISSGAMDAADLRQFRWAIEDLDTEVLIAPNLNEVLAGRVELRPLPTMPLLSVTSGPSRPQRIVKNVMDRVLAFVLLVGISPIIGIAALAVRATSPGGAIFRQQRVGIHGRPFTMFKLRSMVTDAESLKVALEAEGNKGGGALFKLADDPRITRVGKVLRRFSIDELPQIWNVLRGDMSLVGPRPPLPSEVATYDDVAAHRLHIKPGLTGLWQVSGRADLSWEESVKLDLRYIDNFSLVRDVQILARTFRAVFGASGAY